MIDLTRYIVRSRIVSLDPAPREVVLRRLLDACWGAEFPPLDVRELIRSLKEQELGHGFSLVHARVPGEGDIRLAVGLVRPAGESARASPVPTIICALIPENRSREYLSLLARLSRFLSTPGVAETFREGNPERILDAIRAFESS